MTVLNLIRSFRDTSNWCLELPSPRGPRLTQSGFGHSSSTFSSLRRFPTPASVRRNSSFSAPQLSHFNLFHGPFRASSAFFLILSLRVSILGSTFSEYHSGHARVLRSSNFSSASSLDLSSTCLLLDSVETLRQPDPSVSTFLVA